MAAERATVQNHRTLVKGGHVLSMDESLGDLEIGDVLIEGGKIVAVDRDLGAAADEVIDASGMLVLPGLIDSHIHLWQTPLRGAAGETWADEYFKVIHPVSGRFSPEDMRIATYAGAVELLSHGVTTVCDYCHSVNSPEIADASIDGLEEAGIRALFGYSFRDRPEVERRAFNSLEDRIGDVRRLRRERLSDESSLVGLAIALNNIEEVDAETNGRELDCARELGVPAMVHSIRPWQIDLMHERGRLGNDLLWVHATKASDDELDLLAEHGGAILATPEAEVGLEGLYPMTGRCVRHGVPVALGVDVVSGMNADLLVQLRFAFQVERLRDVQIDLSNGRTPKRTATMPTLSAREVLRLATSKAAQVLGIDDRTGTLTPGKDADLLLVSTRPFGLAVGDPAAHVVLQASAADVHTVLVRGEARVREGRLVDVDEDRLETSLYETRERLLGSGAAHDTKE